jgi:hypothetical protein
MAPSKAERNHEQLHWHQARLYVTIVKSNGTKQVCTLPQASQMAPSKAERNHGQIHWHQARLYITMGKSNGTKQGCTLPQAGRMAPKKVPLLTCNTEKKHNFMQPI